MSSFKRIYIQNIDPIIKDEFVETAKAMKVTQAYLFEDMWKVYKKQKSKNKES